MTPRLTTGVSPLDRVLGGGLPAGSLVVVQTDPASQGELLLKEVSAVRDTVYVTGTRTVDAVESWLADAASDPTVVATFDGDPFSTLTTSLRDLSERSTVVVDPVNVFESAERDRATYLDTLQFLKRRAVETESVVFLHALAGPDDPAHRWLTYQLADGVWSLSLDTDATAVETRLAVTKFRNADVPTETLKLELGTEVRVDTSRDIA